MLLCFLDLSELETRACQKKLAESVLAWHRNRKKKFCSRGAKLLCARRLPQFEEYNCTIEIDNVRQDGIVLVCRDITRSTEQFQRLCRIAVAIARDGQIYKSPGLLVTHAQLLEMPQAIASHFGRFINQTQLQVNFRLVQNTKADVLVIAVIPIGLPGRAKQPERDAE